MEQSANTTQKKHHSRLVVESGENEGMIFPLSETVISVGRGPENSIQIIDSHMSRNHSLLIMNEGAWFLRDLGSKNGTQLNGQLIQSDQLLSNGDQVRIGDTLFSYEQENGAIPARELSAGFRMFNDEGMVVPSHVLKMNEEHGEAGEPAGAFIMPSPDVDRLNALYQVSDVISSVLDLNELMEKIIDLVQQFLSPDRAAILLYDEHYNVLLPKAIRYPADYKDDIVVSNSIIDRAVSEQVAVLVSDAPRDFRFKSSDSIVIQRIHSAICAPLVYKHEVLGVLYLDRRYPARSYQEKDLRLVGGIALQAAMAIANSRLHGRLLEQHAQDRELAIARTIQENLLPKAIPALPGFEISGFSHPALMVGGDYFDVIPLADGRYVVAIADVSGKGVPAALLISAVRAAVQIEVRGLKDDNLVEIIDRLNQMVCRDTSGNMFVTMVLGLLDPEPRSFRYVNAGHVHPILFLPDGRTEILDTGGCFLGIMPGMTFDQGSVTLPLGSTLIMYSDGVTDMMNPQRDMFGMHRLMDLLTAIQPLQVDMICQKMEEAALDFRSGAEPFDDFTFLALKSLKVGMDENR